MIDKDAHIAALEADLLEARAQLRAEQDAARKIVQRLCAALGSWTGPWDVAAEARLKGKRTK